VHARVQRHHHQRSRHPLAGDIAQRQRHAAIGVREETVIVAAHRPARRVVAGQIDARQLWRASGQCAALDLGRLREVADHDALGLFHFRQPRVFNANGGHVGHHRQQAQIVFGEFAQDERRIDVDQPMMRFLVCSGTAIMVWTFCSTMLMRLRKASSSCASRTRMDALSLSTRSRTPVLMRIRRPYGRAAQAFRLRG